MELITPEIGLIVWQTVVFVILVLLLAKFAWRPILNLIEERETSINEALESAENAKIEMKNLKSTNERLIKEAREERDAMLKEAREIKDKMISDAAADAEQKADSIILKAQEAIAAEKQAALSEIKSQVASLSIEIAEKVVKRELANKEDQMSLVDNMLDEVKLN